MFYRAPRKGIDPKTATIKLAMRAGVGSMISGSNRRRRQFTRTQGIVDSFPGERLNHARGIADEK